MKFPSIKSVRSILVDLHKNIRKENRSIFNDGEGNFYTDCRLQVRQNGDWCVHIGSSDYDQDHRGVWGAGILSYDRQNLTDLARDLIEQSKDQYADMI